MATALLLLIPAATATVGAESAQQSTVSDSVKSDAARPAADNAGQAPPANQAPSATQMQPDSQARPKSLTDKAIEKVKQVAKTASDIFSRVPCLPPKGAPRTVGSLRRVAHKLAAGEPVVIVAFGSSSTQGYGTSAPEFTYPNRLAAQLHRKYPTADITVINRGHGGDDAREM
ncbi:MAG: SGNH/GDSL hydrolase family protein, partial [Bradyrhizobium sp.]